MLPEPESRSVRRDWAWVAAWCLLLFAAVPLARTLQALVAASIGRRAFLYLVVALTAVATFRLVWRVRRAPGGATGGQVAWLVGVAMAFAWGSYALRHNPEEALHYVEYGVLSYLVFRALSHSVRDWSIYLSAVLVCFLVGLMDEALQWLTPNRYFDFRDIRINTSAAVLVQLAVARGLRPAFIGGGIRPVSVRLTCRLGMVSLLVLGCCLANTPARVEAYAARVPGLAFLHGQQSVMNEFGYRHVIPDIATFRSRFSREALLAADREQAASAAPILAAHQDPTSYHNFLLRYGAGVAPFVHEARVHLYRRDRYRHAAASPESQPKERRQAATVAYREQQILKAYFGQTLSRSGYALRTEQEEALRDAQDPEVGYTSPVSSNLVTVLSEGQVWALMLCVLGGLVAVDRRYGAARYE